MLFLSTIKGEVTLVIVLYIATTLAPVDAINQYILSEFSSDTEPIHTGLTRLDI